MGTSAATPESDHLFTVRYYGKTQYLPEEQAHIFQHMVEQLMFTSDRESQDINMAVSLLITIVKKLDEENWGKLKRVLKYLKGTREMKLTLSVGDMSVVKWWIDALYAAHEEFWGQTGAMMSLGNVSVYSFPKNKINGKISTEGELIGVDDAMSKILWSRYIIEAQGYKISHNRLMQDNKISILLEKRQVLQL